MATTNNAATINYIKYFKGSHTCKNPVTHDDLDKWTVNDFINNGFTKLHNTPKNEPLYFPLISFFTFVFNNSLY